MADCSKDITSASGTEDKKSRREKTAGLPSSETTKKDARKKKKVTNDDIERSNFEQYILTQNIEKAANYYLSHQDLFNYRTFRQINGPGAQLVNKLRGIDSLDVFYNIKNSVLSLMRPKIRIYKVTYEEFVEDNDLPNQGKIVSLPQPCYREFKFSDNFGLETAISVENYLSYESTKPHWRNVGLDSFSVKQDGKRYGVVENNIECSLSLTFKSLKDIQASPPGEPPPEQGGLRYVDLFTWAPSRTDRETENYNPKHYEIKVLLGYTAPSEDSLRGLSLTEKDLRAIRNVEKLNIILSLSLYDYTLDVKDNGQVKFTGKYRGRIETTIGTNQVNIFQNTFRLTRDGAVDVSRRVNAEHNISRVFKLRTMIASMARLLNSPSCKDENCKARKTLREVVPTDLFLAAILKEGFAVGNAMPVETGMSITPTGAMKILGDGSAMFEFFKNKENTGKIQALIKRKVGLYKKDVYKTFVDQFIDGNTDPGAPGTRLFCINAGTKEVEKSLGVILDDKYKKDNPGVSTEDEKVNITEEESKKSTTTAVPKGDTGIKIDRCHLVNPIDPEIKNTTAQEIVSAVDLESKSKDEKKEQQEAHKDKARASIRDFSGKNYKFYFIYLGDIIELACKNAGLGKLDLKSNENIRNEGYSIFSEDSYFPKDEQNSTLEYPLKNARILLGPLEYYNDNDELKTINLAQLPISFNFFRDWFMKKVVRRRRPMMPLGSFLTSLINDLVMPALGAGMPRGFKPPKTRTSLVSLTLPGKQSPRGVERTMCGQSIGKFEEALPMRQTIDVGSAAFERDYYSLIKQSVESETLLKTSFDYLLIYVTTHKGIIDRRGDPAQDLKDGIYHFNIGSDMGLLKNMKFKRNNIPGLVELRSRQAEEQGVDSLDQLKFPYDTSINLAGTSLFTPGMFYYINPSLAGLGSVEDAHSLAYKMNLGGYHLIMTVTTKITSDRFDTSIVGTQTGTGRRR